MSTGSTVPLQRFLGRKSNKSWPGQARPGHCGVWFCQSCRTVRRSSTSGNDPRMRSSRRSHSQRSLSNRICSRRTCSRRSRTCNPRPLSHRPGVSRCFLCQRHRTSTNSRRRFPPHRERLRGSVRCFAALHPPPVRWLTRTLHPPVLAITRQPPIPVRLYSDGFASKLASDATFRVSPIP